MGDDRPITRRMRVKHETSFKERLLKSAREAREAAEPLPLGKARDQLLRKARACETAASIDEWVSSPGLQPPRDQAKPAGKSPRGAA